MRKLLQASIYLVISIFLFTSCEAWEDESYHPGGNNNGGGLLLKEVKTTSNGVEGKATYTYDNQNRVKEVYSYASILDMQTYSHTVNTYNGSNNVTSETTAYNAGIISMTTNISTQVSGNTANVQMVVEYDMGGETMEVTTTNQLTFSAPCGTTENIMNIEMPGFPPMESTMTYEYTDANCSSKHYTDGALTATVTNDDKFSPFTSPEAYAMGISTHNPVRIENEDGSIETITYTYNEQNYPIKAVHTFSGTSTEANYTEEFTYY